MKSFTLLLFIFLILLITKYTSAKDWELNDDKYKFTVTLPDNWIKTDNKETSDQDAISYSFEEKDKKCSMMILAFKLTTVKNLEDFIYTMEKDVSLNIPSKTSEYTAFDNGNYDSKSATYKDQQFTEKISYFRTKLPDATYNFVYMIRGITTNDNYNANTDSLINRIISSFLPTSK